jgi:uncharacterized protein
MRRKDKEVTDRVAMELIIKRSSVCRLGLSDDYRPYVIPICFGFSDNTLYFHSAPEGKKIDILRKNNNVCFEFDIDHEIVSADNPCNWTMKYRSVVGFGKASIIEGAQEKRGALAIIMEQYSDKSVLDQETNVDHFVVFKVSIDSMTGRVSVYQQEI